MVTKHDGHLQVITLCWNVGQREMHFYFQACQEGVCSRCGRAEDIRGNIVAILHRSGFCRTQIWKQPVLYKNLLLISRTPTPPQYCPAHTVTAPGLRSLFPSPSANPGHSRLVQDEDSPLKLDQSDSFSQRLRLLNQDFRNQGVLDLEWPLARAGSLMAPFSERSKLSESRCRAIPGLDPALTPSFGLRVSFRDLFSGFCSTT